MQSKEGDAVHMERQNQVLVHKVAEQQQEIAKRDEQIAKANKELQVVCSTAALALEIHDKGTEAFQPANGLLAVQCFSLQPLESDSGLQGRQQSQSCLTGRCHAPPAA